MPLTTNLFADYPSRYNIAPRQIFGSDTVLDFGSTIKKTRSARATPYYGTILCSHFFIFSEILEKTRKYMFTNIFFPKNFFSAQTSLIPTSNMPTERVHIEFQIHSQEAL